ncbi:hypothetical protein ACFQLZ_12535 [Halospeciosus flavus]
MSKVSDRATSSDELGRNDLPEAEGDEFPEVEVYETEDGVVLYDSDNPLAWLKASNAQPLADLR